jgi:hypothetical protein
MKEIFKKLKLIHGPTEEMPWMELEYEGAEDLGKLVDLSNELNNIARLDPYDQPLFFRGQSNAEWGLKPRIVRLLEGVPIEKSLKIEYDSITFFSQQAHIFSETERIRENSSFKTMGDWLPLMQHYSAPTRLLDWSTSFNVALYFAVTDKPLDEKGAVWFFSQHAVRKWMEEKYPELSDEEYKKILSCSHEFINFGVNRARPKLGVFDTQQKFERIVSQGSIFTYSEKLFVDHAKLIGSALWDSFKNNPTIEHFPLCKIVMLPNAKKFLRQHLSKLNITASTLFPGIDGIGRAITEIIRVECETFFGK